MLVMRAECNKMLQFQGKQGKKVGRNYTIGFFAQIIFLPQTHADTHRPISLAEPSEPQSFLTGFSEGENLVNMLSRYRGNKGAGDR